MRLSAAMAMAALRGTRVHVHVCGHNVSSYAMIGLACGGSAPYLPPVVTLHSGMTPQFLWSHGISSRVALGALLGRAAAVICVSGAIAEAVSALGLNPDRIHVITPFIAAGLRPARAPREVDSLRSRCDRVCAAVVAPGHEYGADVLVEGFVRAATLEPRLGLVVYGPGGVDRHVARAASAHGLAARVLALGELPHDQALGVVEAADVFVRATRADGDALSVREAIHLGTTVVASDAAPRPDGVVRFKAGDARALADALVASPPGAPGPVVDGFPDLLRLYARLGVSLFPEEESTSCVVSPDA
jgi:glycosyltransferase involved in cell wall biosynthesis